MTLESIVIILVIGAVAGWLAGLLFRGFGFGIIGNIVVGIIGGFIGTWLLAELSFTMPGSPIIAAILTALAGAIVLLAVIGLFAGLSGRRRR